MNIANGNHKLCLELLKIFGFSDKDLITSFSLHIEANREVEIQVGKLVSEEKFKELIDVLNKYNCSFESKE